MFLSCFLTLVDVVFVFVGNCVTICSETSWDMYGNLAKLKRSGAPAEAEIQPKKKPKTTKKKAMGGKCRGFPRCRYAMEDSIEWDVSKRGTLFIPFGLLLRHIKQSLAAG